MEDKQSGTPESHNNEAVIAAAEAAAAERLGTLVKANPRLRRAFRALHSLDLLPVVGKQWITLGDDGDVHFAPLSLDQLDKVICILEDIVDGVVTVAPRPGPGQLAFDFEPAPPSLPSLLATAIHHAGAAR